MRKLVAALGLLIAWVTPVMAGGLGDAQTCLEGTRQPAPEYLAYCTRAIEGGMLGRITLAMTHNNRGAILALLEQEDAALADFDRALALNPELSQSYINRGKIRLERDDRQGAFKDFNAAIRTAPQDSRGYVNRSGLYMQSKQYDAALKDLNRALKLNPKDTLAYRNRAILYHRDGDNERAYADSKKAIAYGIDKYIARGLADAGVYSLRAKIDIARGRYRQALANFDRALQLRDDLHGIYNSRAWILATAPQAELRNGQEAVRSAKIAVKLDDSPEYRDTLAAAYAEVGAFDKAIAEEQRAIEMLNEAGETKHLAAFQQVLNKYRQGQPHRTGETDG